MTASPPPETAQTGTHPLRETPKQSACERLFRRPEDGVLEAVAQAFDLACGKFPIPRWKVPCPNDPGFGSRGAEDPHRGGYNAHLSRIHYGRRKQSAHCRADLVLKCTACSRAWTHGIPIPREVHDRALEDHGNTWQWREVREELREAGLIPGGENPQEGDPR